MKFLRIANKNQSQKSLPLKPHHDNKENIDPSQLKKASSKPLIPQPQKNIAPQAIAMEAEAETTITILSEENSALPQRQEETYEREILEFLLKHVRSAPEHYNYFDRQPDISQHMRVVLLNWLIDVHLKYKLHPQTFFITVNIIDTYLSSQIVYRNQLQLVGITALWIAAKYEETYQVPKIANLVYICDSTYTDSQILEMQSKILQEMKFDFLKTSSFSYYEVIKRNTLLKEKDQFLGRYLLEGMLFDVSTRKYTELTVAAAVIFFIQKLRGYELTKPQKVSEITGVSQKQLRACARQICNKWHKINEVNELSSLRQKYMRPEFMQVAKIRLSEKIEKASSK